MVAGLRSRWEEGFLPGESIMTLRGHHPLMISSSAVSLLLVLSTVAVVAFQSSSSSGRPYGFAAAARRARNNRREEVVKTFVASIDGASMEQIEDVNVAYSYGKTKTSWQNVRDLGNNSWAGLIPGTKDAAGNDVTSLDTLLRTELIKYGELTQVTYDGFEGSPKPKQYWQVGNLLDKTASTTWHKIHERYDVKEFLYATREFVSLDAVDDDPVWIGYVAITKDDQTHMEPHEGKDIVVAFRGTIVFSEWGIDATIYKKDYTSIFTKYKWKPRKDAVEETRPHKFRMHEGFYRMYTRNVTRKVDGVTTSPQRAVQACLKELMAKEGDKVKSITFVGHSLGGALATVAAADVGVMRKYDADFDSDAWAKVALTAYTYAAPHVATSEFRAMLDESIYVRLLNVANKGDVVPLVPIGINSTSTVKDLLWATVKSFLPRGGASTTTNNNLGDYSDSGTTLHTDSKNSPEIRNINAFWPPTVGHIKNELGAYHNLEGYIFNIAKQHTSPDRPSLFRDIALMDKSDDLLREEIATKEGIIPRWWTPTAQQLVTKTEGDNIVWRKA